ncbi:MAG TPA: PQQ-binding-like beta-propeller repeat protein [bacterium]|nr:PQQ-binding-like beta-propeller repeat protein [bacterium]
MSHCLSIPLRVAVSLIFMYPVVYVECSGEESWEYRITGGYFDSSPAIADVDGDGTVDIVLGGTSGIVVVLDANGREIWQAHPGSRICVPPSAGNVLGDPLPEVLVLTENGRLVCLAGPTGAVLWEYQLPAKVKWASMTILLADMNQDGDLEIITGDQEGTLVCLSGNGTLIWSIQESEGIGSAPAAGDLNGDGYAEILIATEETPLICLSHEGTVLWRMSPPPASFGPILKREVAAPVIWDLQHDGIPEILTGYGKSLAAVDPHGNLLWTYPMNNQIDSAIAVADADENGEVEIYAADLSAKFVCLDPQGKEKWSAGVEQRVRRSPAIADLDGDGIAEILIAGYSRTLYVYRPDGTQKEVLPLKGATNAAPTVAYLPHNQTFLVVLPEISGAATSRRWNTPATEPLILWPEYRFNAQRTASQFPPSPELEKARISDLSFGNLYTDSSEFQIRISNPDRHKISTELTILYNNEPIAHTVKNSSRKDIAIQLRYRSAEIHSGDLTFRYAVQDNEQEIAAQTYVIPRIPFKDQQNQIGTLLTELDRLVPQLPDPTGMTEQLHSLKIRLEDSGKSVDRIAFLTPMERRALRDELSELNGKAVQMRQICEQVLKEKIILAVSAANPWAPFGGMEEILEGLINGTVAEIEAFHGETESAAFNLFNFSGVPRSVQVELQDLSDGSDTRSLEKAISLHEVISVPTQRSDLSADALPQLGPARIMTLPAWEARQLWFSVDTSRLQPGSRNVRVKLRTVEVEPVEAEAELHITVWKTPLPQERTFSLCHWSGTDQPEGALEDQIAHGVNVFVVGVPAKGQFDPEGNLVGEIDYLSHDAVMTRHTPHGIVLFHRLAQLEGPAPEFSPVWQKAYNAFIHKWVAHLKEMGIGYDRFAFYPIDEPGLNDGRGVEIFMQWAVATQEADPEVRMYANPVPQITWNDLQRMAPYVDIWCPYHLSWFPEDKLAFIRKTETIQWTYACADNAKHLSPLAYYRARAWQVRHFGFTGMGFYTYYLPGVNPWLIPSIGFDYQMVYSGESVVISKRWEAVRDGVEDFEMLIALNSVAEKARLEGTHLRLVEEVQHLHENSVSEIARFCEGDEDGTTPGPDGFPHARVVADKRWSKIQAARRVMANLFARFAE